MPVYIHPQNKEFSYADMLSLVTALQRSFSKQDIPVFMTIDLKKDVFLEDPMPQEISLGSYQSADEMREKCHDAMFDSASFFQVTITPTYDTDDGDWLDIRLDLTKNKKELTVYVQGETGFTMASYQALTSAMRTLEAPRAKKNLFQRLTRR